MTIYPAARHVTLFRRPRVSEADFAADAEAVERDLAALKGLLQEGVTND